MPAYMSRGAGVLTKVRIEFRLSLDQLMYALIGSNEETGEEFPIADVRRIIARQIEEGGTDGFLTVLDNFDEHDDERMEWARGLVVRAYRRDFAQFPDVLARFEASTHRRTSQVA